MYYNKSMEARQQYQAFISEFVLVGGDWGFGGLGLGGALTNDESNSQLQLLHWYLAGIYGRQSRHLCEPHRLSPWGGLG